jgi:hypothetical protein
VTGVALLIAAFTYRKSVRDSARTQASTVTVWVVESAGGARTVHVKNGSNASVYAVTVYYGGKYRSRSSSPYYRVRDKESGLKGLGQWPSIGPGGEESVRLKRNPLTDPEIPWLYFRDANGIDWIRDYRARLKRHDYTQSLSEMWYLDKGIHLFRVQLLIALLLYGIGKSVKGFFKRVGGIFKRRAAPAATSASAPQSGPSDSQ